MRGTRAGRTETDRTFDQLWGALDHVERRRVLLTLLDRDRPVEVATAVEGDDPLTERRAALRDEHLPALAEAGLVDWDPQTRRVAPGPAYDGVEPLLRPLAERQVPDAV